MGSTYYDRVTDLINQQKQSPKSQLKSTFRRENEAKTLGSISKELSGKAFIKTLETFKPTGGLIQKKVTYQPNFVSINFSSPLEGIEVSCYVKKFKCEELIGDESTSCCEDGKSSVVAVKLSWKRGVKVERTSSYSRNTRMIEPEMTTTNLSFDSKLKFQRDLHSIRDELFPSDNSDLVLLDGNDCHGRMTMKSKQVQKDSTDEPEAVSPRLCYTDTQERELLLVPSYSKLGFDVDTTKRYNFPYLAKFTIGKKTYEHQFQLRLSLSQKPQHFGLVFNFLESPTEGRPQPVVVKSLLTVYSLFPASPKLCTLITYKNSSEEVKLISDETLTHPSKKKFVDSLAHSVSSKLREETLANVWQGKMFTIGCKVSHPNQLEANSHYSGKRNQLKSKGKQNLARSIQADTLDVIA